MHVIKLESVTFVEFTMVSAYEVESKIMVNLDRIASFWPKQKGPREKVDRAVIIMAGDDSGFTVTESYDAVVAALAKLSEISKTVREWRNFPTL